MTNVIPPLTPPLRVTKNHPLFFTRKTLSEELKRKSTWKVSRSGLRPNPPKFFSSKSTFWEAKNMNPLGWRLQNWPQTPPSPAPPWKPKVSTRALHGKKRIWRRGYFFVTNWSSDPPHIPVCDICHKKSVYFFKASLSQKYWRTHWLCCVKFVGQVFIIFSFFSDLPKVLSRILLYIIAEDFLWTILCVIAWYFLLNSFSLWVDSMEADLFREWLQSKKSSIINAYSIHTQFSVKENKNYSPDSISFLEILLAISPTKTQACFWYSPK